MLTYCQLDIKNLFQWKFVFNSLKFSFYEYAIENVCKISNFFFIDRNVLILGAPWNRRSKAEGVGAIN